MAAARPAPRPLGPLLAGVSRSFYLSIRLLPGPVRAPIGVAYLLARATDTVADGPDLEPAYRLALLDGLRVAVETGALPAALAGDMAVVAGRLPDPAEAALLRALPACLEAFRALAPADQQEIRTLLAQIVQGQRLDVERFPQDGHVRSLASDDEAVEYMDLVAGCVGVFWTRTCARHLAGWSDLADAELERLGRSFGRGLQRVNILRDARADLAIGRCYFPGGPQAIGALRPDWLARAESAMDDGLRYAGSLSSARLRVACALPALVGLRTVALLRAEGEAALCHRVKMPRAEVRRLLAGAALSFGSRAWIARSAARLRENRAP